MPKKDRSSSQPKKPSQSTSLAQLHNQTHQDVPLLNPTPSTTNSHPITTPEESNNIDSTVLNTNIITDGIDGGDGSAIFQNSVSLNLDTPSANPVALDSTHTPILPSLFSEIGSVSSDLQPTSIQAQVKKK